MDIILIKKINKMVVFGLVFVSIIILCILSTIVGLFIDFYNDSDTRNNKLIENIKKLDERK